MAELCNSDDDISSEYANFQYEIAIENIHVKILENVPIHNTQRMIHETTYYIIRKYGLLWQHFEELSLALVKFVKEQEKLVEQKIFEKSLSILMDDTSWNTISDKYKRHHLNFTLQTSSLNQDLQQFNNQVKFSEIYTHLLDSNTHEIMNRLESSYALFLEKSRQKYRNEINLINEKMKEAAQKQLPVINILQKEKTNLKQAWKENITALKVTQKKEYTNWIMETYNSLKSNDKIVYNEDLVISSGSIEPNNTTENIIETQESFTVYLGHQHKTNFNICIIKCNLTKYYSAFEYRTYESMIHNYNMYTKNVAASVMAVDTNIPSNFGYAKIFNSEVAKLTEFHFQQYNEQLENIKNCINNNNRILNEGDVYITKHSNLLNLHINFHVVINPEKSQSNSIASSSPEMQAIANILSYCLKHGCGNIDIPLLFTSFNFYKENMDENLLLKRSESFLKCIKGFLIHSCMWENESFKPTIRFLIPKSVSEKFIDSIIQIIPTIYTIK